LTSLGTAMRVMGLLGLSATQEFDHARLTAEHRGSTLERHPDMRLLSYRPQSDGGSKNIGLQP